MTPASKELLIELRTRLKEAEDRVVRLHFPAMVNTVPILDHEGQGEISLLYACLFATAAELDYLERAAHLYTQRKPSFSSTLKPYLITLCIGAAEQRAAAACGISVWVDGYRPTEEPKAAKPASPIPFRPRIKPPSLPSSPSVSPFSSQVLSTTTPRSQTPPHPSKTPSLNSSTSSGLGAPLMACGSSEVTTKTGAPPSQDLSYIQLDWEGFLAGAGFEPSVVTCIATAFAHANLAVPADPRTLKWDQLRELTGLKMGYLTKLKKYVDTKYGELA